MLRLVIELELERSLAEKLVAQLDENAKINLISANIHESLLSKSENRNTSNATTNKQTQSQASQTQSQASQTQNRASNANQSASRPDSESKAGQSSTQTSQGSSSSANSSPSSGESNSTRQEEMLSNLASRLEAKFGKDEPVYGAGTKVIEGKISKAYKPSELFAVSEEGKKTVNDFYVAMKNLVSDTSQALQLRQTAQMRMYWTEKVWIENGVIDSFSPVLIEEIN